VPPVEPPVLPPEEELELLLEELELEELMSHRWLQRNC